MIRKRSTRTGFSRPGIPYGLAGMRRVAGMRRGLAWIAPATVVGLSIAALAWWPEWRREKALAQPPTEAPEPSAWQHAELHARYAKSLLRLAEMRLQKLESLNAISPGQITETDLRPLRTRIDLLRAQVDETRSKPHGYGFAAQRTAAHAAVRLAEQDLAAAVAVNSRKSDAVAPFEIRLRELRLETARLRAQIWEDPAFLASPYDVLQMQIDQITDQLQDVLHGIDNAPCLDRR